MTYEEAITVLKANEERKLATDYCRIKDMTIKALEKQVSKKPDMYDGAEMCNGRWFCPKCHVGYSGMHPLIRHNYCPNCGQKIDWSDYI